MNAQKTVAVVGSILVVVLIAQAVALGVLQWGSRSQAKHQTEKLERIVGVLQSGSVGGNGDNAVSSQLKKTNKGLQELLGVLKESGNDGGVTGGQTMVEAALLLSTAGDSQIRSNAASIMGRLGGEKAEKRLVEMAKNDPQTSSQVIHALQEMGSQKAGELIMDMLQNGTRNERRQAANYLPNVITRDMMPEVLKLLKNLPFSTSSSSDDVRREIYEAIGQVGAPKAADAMLRAVQNEMDEYARREAVQAFLACLRRKDLKKVGGVLDVLGPAGQDHGSSRAHREVIEYLGETGDYRGTKYILPFLDSGNKYLQREAMQAVAQLRDPAAAKELVAYFKSADDQEARYLEQYLRNGYPGIKKEDGAFVLVAEEKLKKLMKKRNEAVARMKKRFGDDKEEKAKKDKQE